jgi:hypothetical protein
MSGIVPPARRSVGAQAPKETTMSEFLYLYRGGEKMTAASAIAMQEQMQRWVAWIKELADKGHIKSAGHPLESTGKVVSGKSKTVTDGPFAEKDLVGGYSVIEAKEISEAVELAKGCPIFLTGGHVEVRPILNMNM